MTGLDRTSCRLPMSFWAKCWGVKRSTVSVVTRTLQTTGLIQQSRGDITVIDRAGFEETNCECYRRIRRIYQRLLPGTYPPAQFR
jgi:hypothetical protein